MPFSRLPEPTQVIDKIPITVDRVIDTGFRSYMNQFIRTLSSILTFLDEEVQKAQNKYKSVSVAASTYTVNVAEEVILCDTASNAITLTLPSAASMQGKKLLIKKINNNSNTVTVDGNLSETIDNSSTLVLAGSAYSSTVLYSDGVEWWTF